MNRTLAMLCLIAAMTMTGANVPVAKRLVTAFEPETLLALRFALATVVLVPLAHAESGPRLADLSARQWRSIAILGVVGSVMFTWFILAGVQRTSAASAGIILSALPAVVALIGFARGDRPRFADVAMIGLAVVGVALVQVHTMHDGASGHDSLPGNLLVLMAVLCEAAFVIAARRISAEVAPMRLCLGVALVSLLATLPGALATADTARLVAVPAATWALFAGYVLTSSVLCTWLWYLGVRHVEPWATGLATAAVPVAALATSVFAFAEMASALQVAGAALVVAAIASGTLVGRR